MHAPPPHPSPPSVAQDPARALGLRRLHWWLLACSTLLTIFVAEVLRRNARQEEQSRFVRRCTHVRDLIEERLRHYEDALWAGVGLLNVSNGYVSHGQWKTFAETLNIENKYPGINGIGIIYHLHRHELAQHLRTQRASRAHYRVHPPHAQDELLPITYIEPVGPNREAVGLDMVHEPHRYGAANATRTTGRPHITAPIVLVQDTSQTPGFLLFVPFYRGRDLSSDKARTQQFEGFIYAPFVVRRLLAGTIDQAMQNLDVRILDGRQVLYEPAPTQPAQLASPGPHHVELIEVYGRQWRFEFSPAHAPTELGASAIWAITLLAGLTIDSLLFMIFLQMARSGAQLERAHLRQTQMIDELQASQELLEKQRASLENQRRAALNIAEDAQQARSEAERARQESEQFKQIVESSEDAIICLSTDGRVQTWNPGAASMFGITESEAIGMVASELTHPDSTARFQDRLSQAVAGVQPETFNIQLVSRDGHGVTASAALSPLRSESRAVVGVTTIFLDISATADAEHRFERAVESAPNGMVMVDAQGKIVLVNAETERMFGYERHELIGHSVEKLLPRSQRDDHIRLRNGYLSAPKVRRMAEGRELHGRRKSGVEFPVEVGLNPVQTRTGSFVLGSVIDQSERTRLLIDLRHKGEEIEQLLFSVSHDLKSPLVTIRGFSRMLREAMREGDMEDCAQLALRIDAAAEQMFSQINDLLEVGRIGRTLGSNERVHTQQIVLEVLELLHDEIARKQPHVTVAELPDVVSTPPLLRQIFQNLIGNTLAHACTRPGVEIEVGHRSQASHHEFFVRDNGPGIGAHQQGRIFDPFIQLRQSAPGSGMGLAIVRKSARLLGGNAWLESEPGQGATFYFSIPKVEQGSV